MEAYQPSAQVLERLHGKTLVMLVGPTAVGKSSVMNEAVRFDTAFARVSGLTTRARRPNDEPGLYRYVSDKDAQRLIARHELVQYVVHPTTGKLYGTEPKDFPGYYNLQDTLSNSVAFYKSLPFARHVTVSLTTSPAAWTAWLDERYPIGDAERRKRLLEAKSSIEWSLARNESNHWLVNAPGNLRQTAERLIAIARGTSDATTPPPEAEDLLRTVHDLLSYG